MYFILRILTIQSVSESTFSLVSFENFFLKAVTDIDKYEVVHEMCNTD